MKFVELLSSFLDKNKTSKLISYEKIMRFFGNTLVRMQARFYDVLIDSDFEEYSHTNSIMKPSIPVENEMVNPLDTVLNYTFF